MAHNEDLLKPRARDLGIPFHGETGPFNAITDVPGVQVGSVTLTDTAKSIRTGVTAVLPRTDQGYPHPVRAGHYALNGNGEMTGTHWIDDAGYFIGPICITNTHSVGAVHHGTTQWMIKQYAEYFESEHAWAMPVVAETYDGVLNDINAMHIQPEHAIAALNSASTGAVAEGSTGGGNGMICYEFKGGTGTSSRSLRIAGTDYTVGVLVQANHGIRPWLNIRGVAVGEILSEHRLQDRESGSIIVVIATDAPLGDLALRHCAKRAALGIARGGSPGGHSSGDIFLAFSVADDHSFSTLENPILQSRQLRSELLDPVYLAVVEAIEEAVVNAMVAGEDVETFKPPGQICKALDTDALRKFFA